MLITPGPTGHHASPWKLRPSPQSPPSLPSVCASSQRPESSFLWEQRPEGGQPPLSPRAISSSSQCVVQALGEGSRVGWLRAAKQSTTPGK